MKVKHTKLTPTSFQEIAINKNGTTKTHGELGNRSRIHENVIMVNPDAIYDNTAGTENKTGFYREIGHKSLEMFDVKQPLPNVFRVNPGLDKSEELGRLPTQLVSQPEDRVVYNFGNPHVTTTLFQDKFPKKQYSYKPEVENFNAHYSSTPNRQHDTNRRFENSNNVNYQLRSRPDVGSFSRTGLGGAPAR